MQPLDRLWFCLESIPGLCLLRSDWEGRLGHELPSAEPFLRPTDRPSQNYPCPDPGGGCVRRVVVHDTGEIVAVCGDSPRRCERVVLTKTDVVLYQFDVPAFCRELARVLEIEPRFEPVTGTGATWVIGVRSPPQGEDFLVYLTIPLEPEDLLQAVSRLVGAGRERFLLLAPTEDNRDLTVRELLRLHPARFDTLKAVLGADPEGKLVLARPVADVYAGLEVTVFDEAANLFQRQGNAWTIRYQGEVIPVADRKGLRYLAPLLRDRDREFHVTELEVAAGESLAVTSEGASTARLGVHLPSDDLDSSGRMLDAEAVTSYRDRLREIEQELAQASADRDTASRERLTQEQKFIEEQFLATHGRHGRSRPAQDRLKRTRDRIAIAIDRALGEIRKHHPDLAQHLDGSLIRGTHWSYRPTPPVDWIV